MLLPVRTVSENIRSDSPNLADIRRLIPKHGDVVVQTILIHALNELKDLVNVGKNLTNAQIAYLSQRIMCNYWMLKPEEVKFVLYRAVEREKLFDRLDPNIVLSWFADYDAERTDEAMRLSDNEAAKEMPVSKDAVSLETYTNRLWDMALYADPEAVEKLCTIQSTTSAGLSPVQDSRESSKKFKTWYYTEYLKSKNGKKKSR